MTDWTQAAVDKLTAAGVKRAYRVGEVPDNPQYAYAVVSASRVATAAHGLAGGHGVVSWFVMVQCFGRTNAEIDLLDGIVFPALQDQKLADDIECGPCDLNVSALTRDSDDGGILCRLSTFRFTVTRSVP